MLLQDQADGVWSSCVEMDPLNGTSAICCSCNSDDLIRHHVPLSAVNATKTSRLFTKLLLLWLCLQRPLSGPSERRDHPAVITHCVSDGEPLYGFHSHFISFIYTRNLLTILLLRTEYTPLHCNNMVMCLIIRLSGLSWKTSRTETEHYRNRAKKTEGYKMKARNGNKLDTGEDHDKEVDYRIERTLVSILAISSFGLFAVVMPMPESPRAQHLFIQNHSRREVCFFFSLSVERHSSCGGKTEA